MTQTAGFGLFHATLCNVLKTSEKRCHTVSDNEAIFVMKQEVPYVENGKYYRANNVDLKKYKQVYMYCCV